MKPADVRARLHDARAMLSEAYVVVDDVGPHLAEPERGAALELRADVADLIRRLANLAAFIPGGGPR